jgi:hypothetical protein
VDKGTTFLVCISGDQSPPAYRSKCVIRGLYAEIDASVGREHLVAVVWVGEAMLLNIARYANELWLATLQVMAP